MDEAKLSSKGQIVIPKHVRDALSLREGSAILMSLEEGRIIIVPKPENALEGLAKAGNELALKNIRREIKEE